MDATRLVIEKNSIVMTPEMMTLKVKTCKGTSMVLPMATAMTM